MVSDSFSHPAFLLFNVLGIHFFTWYQVRSIFWVPAKRTPLVLRFFLVNWLLFCKNTSAAPCKMLTPPNPPHPKKRNKRTASYRRPYLKVLSTTPVLQLKSPKGANSSISSNLRWQMTKQNHVVNLHNPKSHLLLVEVVIVHGKTLEDEPWWTYHLSKVGDVGFGTCRI